PISTATQTALDGKADNTNTYTKGDIDLNLSNLIASAPESLNTLKRAGTGSGERPKPRDNRLQSASNKGDDSICRWTSSTQSQPIQHVHHDSS
ncbi:MAG: hypothetical protein ACKPKO_55390, partial [Candidatus Fonsibacter sp.]